VLADTGDDGDVDLGIAGIPQGVEPVKWNRFHQPFNDGTACVRNLCGQIIFISCHICMERMIEYQLNSLMLLASLSSLKDNENSLVF
jgi:hypothetical protein